MKEKWNQMFKDKLFLVMLVLGLLTIVAAAGVVTTQRGSGQEQNPYVDMQEQGDFIAQQPGKQIQEAEVPERNPKLRQSSWQNITCILCQQKEQKRKLGSLRRKMCRRPEPGWEMWKPWL